MSYISVCFKVMQYNSIVISVARLGWRSNEIAPTRLVGLVDFGSFTSTIAQSPAWRIFAAQWSKVWSFVVVATRLPVAGRTPSRRHGPAHRNPFRRARLRLSQISHASQFRYIFISFPPSLRARDLSIFMLTPFPDVKGLMNRRHVVEAQEQVQQALFDYTLNCYTHIPVRFFRVFLPIVIGTEGNNNVNYLGQVC